VRPLGVAEFPTNRIANIDVMPDVDRRDRRLDGESRRHLLRLSKPSCRALRFCWKPSTPSSRTSESYRPFAHGLDPPSHFAVCTATTPSPLSTVRA
jgi:hypothetical protein